MAINKKKKILITGLSGAVGQAIIPSLKKNIYFLLYPETV